MKRLVFSILAIPAILVCSAVVAQDPDKLEPREGEQQLVDQTQPETTQDMWFYLQELRRYDDPQVMIRRKAEKKAAQRRLRIASQKWFGFSKLRPTANPTPFTGVSAPMWVGNGSDPFFWVGSGHISTAVRIDASTEIRR